MKLDGMSFDIDKDAKERLKAVFSDCFVEDKFDIDKLLTMCDRFMLILFGAMELVGMARSTLYRRAAEIEKAVKKWLCVVIRIHSINNRAGHLN